MGNSAVRVVLSKKAYGQIEDSMIAAKNDFEVGGVLLGYRIFGCCFVAAATVPAETSARSRVSFILDGDWHTACAADLMRSLRRKLRILGIWHSHICAGAVFSEQDRQSNTQFAASCNGALSMLVQLTPLREVRMTVYDISADGRERLCRILRHGKRRPLRKALPNES